MLDLASKTSPQWVERACRNIDHILIDHAHCEKKAASMAINLIFRYVDREAILTPLSALAREELDHFEQVLSVIRERGGRFRPLRPSPYARRLQEFVRKEEPYQRMDTFLFCALIEARSCERMKLLAEHLEDQKLRDFYTSLLACEARHFHGYVVLAQNDFPRDEVRKRLHELAEEEAKILSEPEEELRMHSAT